MSDEPSPDEPIERSLRDYIANGAAEGAISAAERLIEAVGVGLADVLTAVQALRSSDPATAITGVGSVSLSKLAIAGTGRVVALADAGAGTDSLTVVRQPDVEALSAQASRGVSPARLSGNQWILVAVILIAAIYPMLSPELQKTVLDEAGLAAALAAVLVLLKR